MVYLPMRWISGIAPLALCIAALATLPACQQQPIDRDECVATYAQRGGTDKIVRWGYQLCARAADVQRTPVEREQAMCAVKMIPSTPSEIAFRAVVADCLKKGH